MTAREPSFDNGLFHGAVQDAQLGARYSMTRDLWTVTPFTDFIFPVTDYEVLAHAAQGLGLTMLEVGTSVGGFCWPTVRQGVSSRHRRLRVHGEPVRGRLAQSQPRHAGGRLFPRPVSLQALTTWRRVHGGIEWSDLHADSHEHFAGHDQAAATRDWRYVAGVSFQLTEAMSVEMSYGDFLRGANTHSARVSLGWSWGFRAFGVPTLGGGFR